MRRGESHLLQQRERRQEQEQRARTLDTNQILNLVRQQ